MKNLPGNHLSLFILFTIYFCALMTVVNAANTSDIQLLKTQIKDLQTQTKSLQIKTQLLKTQNQDLQSWRNLFSSYCGFSVFGKCGPCICKDDYRLPHKYYCDCRNQPAQRDCLEHRRRGYTVNGLYTLTMNGYKIVNAFCDQKTSGGGWTVIQRRMDGSVNFFRRWQEYKEGFGQLQHEHWLGNDNINVLTAQAVVYESEAMVQIRRRHNPQTLYTSRYGFIQVDSESNNYMLHVKKPSGGLGPSYFTLYNHRMEFSTFDRDNDRSSSYNCARDTQYTGWWINASGNSCTSSTASYTNLNGPYDELRVRTWYKRICWAGSHPLFTEMKIRRL